MPASCCARKTAAVLVSNTQDQPRKEPSAEKQQRHLGEHFEGFIAKQIDAGRFESKSESGARRDAGCSKSTNKK